MSPRTLVRVDAAVLAGVGFDASPTGLVVCDDDGNILLVNRQIETRFGHPAADLAGGSIDVLIPSLARRAGAAGRPEFWTGATRLAGVGRECLGRHRDGTEVPIEVDVAVVMQADRRLVIVSVGDATERVRQLATLRANSEERIAFEQLVANLAARFANIGHDEVDETITDSLHQIADMLDLERGVVWQFTEDGSDMVYTHAWIRPGFGAAPLRVSTRESFPWLLERTRANETVWNASMNDVPNRMDRENLRAYDTRSNAVIPLAVDGAVVGALSFAALRAERSWSTEVRDRLQLMATVFAQALARKRSQEALVKALEEVERLRADLAQENAQLRYELGVLPDFRTIAAESASVRAVLAHVQSVAPTDATVLLLGETGTGKERFAQAIHDLSRRRDRPMVRVNCAAIPAALVENELFGRERGAYTGALSRQIGRFELAHGSTLFLDEIGDLPLESQVKLLRAAQDHVIERLGGSKPIHVDVRLIAATNRDLSRMVADRTFREDLYHRLYVFPITVPPLRERVEDIPVLVWTFIEEFSTLFGKQISSVSNASLEALKRYPWPGNVRELRNLVERVVILASGSHLVIDPPRVPDPDIPDSTLAGWEAEHIRGVLRRVGWRVRGPGGAAELLGVKPTTLESRMVRLGIHRPEREPGRPGPP